MRGGEGVIKEQCKQPVGRHGEHGPLIDLFGHVDVLLAHDGDLLRLVFEVLDVVVDVEDVFVELGEVVELERKEERGRCSNAVRNSAAPNGDGDYVSVRHLLPDGEL